MNVNLSRIHFPITALGPGHRIGIWLQGCSIRCPGCISMDTWDSGKGRTTVADIVQVMESFMEAADGLTVSGGEPFDQPDALRAILTHFRSRHRGDILVYSGRSLEELGPQLSRCAGLIDALIADPFVVEAPQSLALRGSDNQRLVCLTDLGRARFGALVQAKASDGPALDVMFDDETGEVFLAGVPRRGDMRKLVGLLAAGGHSASTTEDKRSLT